MLRQPLSREEVINAIERKDGSKVPLVLHKWWGVGLYEKYGEGLNKMADNFPDDIFFIFYTQPGETVSTTKSPNYRWGYKSDYSGAAKHSIGEATELLDNWSELDEMLTDFPNPNEPDSFDVVIEELPKAQGRYKLGGWWNLFHEALWKIRGMENLMIDYYEEMDNLKILSKKLLEYYKIVIDRFSDLGFDGIFSSDDLGHQTGPMMSPDIFEELYFPLYKELISYVHSKGMHMFLHSCGDNTKLMEFLIEAGLDVFHPIQAGCMDELETATKYGDRISFLAGVDVQHLLPMESVDGVRNGIRKMISNLYKPNGGLLLSAGNGIMSDTPLENIQAMLEEVTLPDILK